MPFFSRSDRSDHAPRRRRGDGDHSARLSFEVESFEFVPAGEGLGLLRLAGAWSANPEQVVPLPVEVEIERDGEAVRLPVLPDPSAPDALALPAGHHWHGAFMAEAELAEDPRADFALVAGGEVVAGLPRPGDIDLDEGYVDADEDEPPAADAAGELSGSEPPVLSDLLAELERVAALEEAVQPLEVEADGVVAEHLAAREAAEARAQAAEDRAGEAESLVALLRHEVETLRGATEAAEVTLIELQKNADRERAAREAAEEATARMRDEADSKGSASDAANEAAEAAAARTAELQERADRERAAREAADAAAAEARAEAEQERGAREEAAAAHAELLAAVETEREGRGATESQLRAAVAEARTELDGTRAELEAARAELEAAHGRHEDTRGELDEAGRERDETRAELEQTRGELDAARRQLDDASPDAEPAGWETERAEYLAQIDALRLDGDRQREHERKAEENERKLTAVHEHLDQARKELDLERRRSSTMEEELRAQVSVERQLRDALAGQEADLATATADAVLREQIAERRGEEPQERGGARQSHEVKSDFFSRVEAAKRLSESSG